MGTVMNEIAEHIKGYIADCGGGVRFDVTTNGGSLIQVLPKRPPIEAAVIDLEAGEIRLVCPPSGLGVGRNGRFKQTRAGIVSLGNFVGQSAPPDEPMTPEAFAEFVMKPLLVPTAA